MLKLKDGRKELYQWDVGVVADVRLDNVDEVHFSNLRYGVSFNIEVKDKTVEIPPEVLQSGADVFCWAFVRGENGGYTKKEQIFNVEKRPRPADYVYEPTEILSWETLKNDILNLEKSSIEVITEEVRLLDLETGLYNVKGGKVIIDNSTMFVSEMTEGILYVYADNYFGIMATLVGKAYIDGVLTTSASVQCYKENDEWKVFQVSTVPVSTFFESEEEHIPTVKAVVDYVEGIKKEIQGDLDEIGDLIGGTVWKQEPTTFEDYTFNGVTQRMAICDESFWNVPLGTYAVTVTIFRTNGTFRRITGIEGELTEINASNPKIYSLSCGSDSGIGEIYFAKMNDTDTVTYIVPQDMTVLPSEKISIELSLVGGAK